MNTNGFICTVWIIVLIIFASIINKIIAMDLVNSYVNHSLNRSKAKAAFSFPKSLRLQ